jgi:UDP-N-acetylglucosamine acyltransferase
VHRSNTAAEDTVIGSHNFVMAGSHVGHNARLGNHIILANGALVSGHVVVGDRAFISGNCLLHQFVRVGTMALMQGGAAISKDLPPFTIAREYNGICGLNIVGLRRAGITAEQRMELKRIYHLLFRSGQNIRAAAAAARREFDSPTAAALLDFVVASTRGVCVDRGSGQSETAEAE